MKEYKPYWPETILFVGAGATAALGLSSTETIGKRLSYLTGIKRELPLRERVEMAFADEDETITASLVDLLEILNDGECENNSRKAAERQGISDVRHKELLRIYDWSALKNVIRRCPEKDGIVSTQDIFNLIDMSIQSNQGIYVGKEFIRPERMQLARNMLILFTAILHKRDYDLGIVKKTEVFKQYEQFALHLAEMMQAEGRNRASKYELNKREYYMFSYGIVSLNWDPLFLWFIFNAHKTLNDQPGRMMVGKPPEQLKLFNDLANFMAVRSIDNKDSPEAWYPMNETAVQRLNDPEHKTGRRVRIGKIYFPHGSHGFRECPNCGKLTFYLGNEWTLRSPDLFPPSIVPSLAYKDRARSKEEKDAYDAGEFDAIQCSHCGSLTEAHHTPIVMQTNFKGQHAPFLEEIQRDMKVAIEKAKHIIMFGYSLPTDDIQYRSILTAKRNMEEDVYCSVVNYFDKAHDGWIEGEELVRLIEKYPNEESVQTCQRAIDIFGKDRVRAYLKGIPAVFSEKGQASYKKVKEMMDWRGS